MVHFQTDPKKNTLFVPEKYGSFPIIFKYGDGEILKNVSERTLSAIIARVINEILKMSIDGRNLIN